MLEELKQAVELKKSIRIFLQGGGFVNIDTLLRVEYGVNVINFIDIHRNNYCINKDKITGYFIPESPNYTLQTLGEKKKVERRFDCEFFTGLEDEIGTQKKILN